MLGNSRNATDEAWSDCVLSRQWPSSCFLSSPTYIILLLFTCLLCGPCKDPKQRDRSSIVVEQKWVLCGCGKHCHSPERLVSVWGCGVAPAGILLLKAERGACCGWGLLLQKHVLNWNLLLFFSPSEQVVMNVTVDQLSIPVYLILQGSYSNEWPEIPCKTLPLASWMIMLCREVGQASVLCDESLVVCWPPKVSDHLMVSHWSLILFFLPAEGVSWPPTECVLCSKVIEGM